MVPLLKIGYDAILPPGLGADPIAEILNRLGFWTLTLLTASLACTPAKILFKIKWPLRIRRMLGLFAFAYAALHFSFYLGVDQFFDLHAVLADIVKRKFILVGFGAFLILSLLAFTSPKRAVRKMGFVRWKRLHRLVYAAAAMGVIHFVWRVKADLREPMIFIVIVSGLLLIRLANWAIALVPRSGKDSTTRPRRTA
jgi:methionine sulfoxide reductase heme-binding subunit